MSKWDPPTVKAQLRLASKRLGQLQERKDSQALAIRREIATLLHQSNIGMARAKGQALMQDDTMADLIEVLEMHVGLLIEHFQEIEQSAPTPIVVEAASSVIFCSPHIDLKELHDVRDLLVDRLGPDFARSAAENLDHYVPYRITNAILAPPASATHLDNYLMNIAQAFSIQWIPEPDRQDIMHVLSEILNPKSAPVVDLPLLRRLCSRGIPDEPTWIRPRIWKLFLGITPPVKASWQASMQKQREGYYDLVRRLLEPFSSLPPPTNSFCPQDQSLLTVSRQLSRLPASLFDGLERRPEPLPLSPFEESAPQDVYLRCTKNLDARLETLRGTHPDAAKSPSIPEIRLHQSSEHNLTTSTPSKTPPNLLVRPHVYNNEADPKHVSAIIRLLYVHTSINPGNLSPHFASLLVPLYSVLYQEVEAEELAHAEADTFWLFETMVGEFSELEDEEGGAAWMKKFGERLAWADPELKDCLDLKGLDPALPHYSYRWLAPLFTQTLPLSSVIVIWDALFSCEMRSRDKNPKLDFLIDVSTSMLLRARAVLQRLGKSGPRSSGLWAEEASNIPPPSPIRAWELGDAFVEGMTLLQAYPIDAAGGVDRVLQTAADLMRRRVEEVKALRPDNRSLGERLRVTMWKGFTNQTASPERSPERSDSEDEDEDTSDGNETETSSVAQTNGLTSRLANTVWRGITNQSSMEPPPSPMTPIAEQLAIPPSPFSPATIEDNLSPKSRSLWGYAEKLKESNAAATFSKVSSNWRARAMLGTWGKNGEEGPVPPNGVDDGHWAASDNGRRSSLPVGGGDGQSSPPSKPAFFKAPRDSIISHSRRPSTSSSGNPELSPQSDGGFMSKTKNLQASLAALTRSQTPQPPKAGPRPLLLSSSNLMTTVPRERPISRSMNSTPTPEQQSAEWKRVMRTKEFHHHRDSMSSISSLSPSDALVRPVRASRAEFDSESTPSRIVPIGRRSLSPRGNNFQLPQPTPQRQHRPLSDGMVARGDTRTMTPESPSLSSPSAPMTPVLMLSPTTDTVQVTEPESVRGSVILSSLAPLEPPSITKKFVRKKTPPPGPAPGETSDSSAGVAPMPRSPRLRSKRHTAKPPHLRLQESNARPTSEHGDSLGVDWPASDTDIAITPKAAIFEADDQPRKSSTGSRGRKTSEVKVNQKRQSAAEEGDDEESYDELISAYSETDEGFKTFSAIHGQ